MTSPLHIEIALWYHTRAAEAGDFGRDENGGLTIRSNAPAVLLAIDEFVASGLLEPTENPAPKLRLWQPTRGLHLYVESPTP